ncbi:MAG: hypothetical protein D6795_08300 [Deltaproteobacteria bacterium]|nr:MAG: hypothetical protein D6795_08300 [Deltaproteobacteria bacterium]
MPPSSQESPELGKDHLPAHGATREGGARQGVENGDCGIGCGGVECLGPYRRLSRSRLERFPSRFPEGEENSCRENTKRQGEGETK